MKNPVLVFAGYQLEVLFPEWSQAQIAAIQETLICWSKKRKVDGVLVATPTILAMWEIRERLPKLQVSQETRAMLQAEIATRTQPATKLDLSELYQVQRTPTALLYNRDRALVTAAPGLGKTIIALTALRHRNISLVVVVAPLTSLGAWENEIRKWYLPHLEAPYSFSVWGNKDTVQPLEENAQAVRVVLTTPSVLSSIATMQSEYGQGLGSVFYDGSHLDTALILDESFLYQNRKSGRTNLMEELAVNFNIIWELSGMPVSKVNDDLYTQLKLLYPQVFRSYWKFANRYCLQETNYWGTRIVGNKPDSEKLLHRDLQDIIIPCEYPKEIPCWLPEDVDCPMTAEQETIYLDMKNKLKVDAATLGADKPLTLKALLTLGGRLLQIASNPVLLDGHDSSGKWDVLLDRLAGDEQPALIWLKYKKTAELLKKKIEERYPHYRLAVLTGATKPARRYEMVAQFQAGELDLLLINDVVGKYSLTLTAAKVAYYLERNFDGEPYYQSLYRARRITSKHPVKIVLLRSTYRNGQPTIDGVVHKILLERSQNAQLLTVGELLGSI